MVWTLSEAEVSSWAEMARVRVTALSISLRLIFGRRTVEQR